MPRRVIQRILLKYWRRFVPHFKIPVGDARIRISGNNLKPAALLRWEYSWKTEMIRRILETELGDFIDIGANVGQTLLDFYAAGVSNRRYIGFEPHPNSFASLRALVAENNFKDCIVLPVGMYESLCVVNLYAKPDIGADLGASTDQGASVVIDLRTTKGLVHAAIVCCRFDDIRADLGIESIGLIKIDVEGAELQVLRGMVSTLETLRPTILCEILYADTQSDIARYEDGNKQITRFLERLNYTTLRINKDQEGKQFQGLVKVEVFPVQFWTPENAHECDYVLIPSEKIESYRGLTR